MRQIFGKNSQTIFKNFSVQIWTADINMQSPDPREAQEKVKIFPQADMLQCGTRKAFAGRKSRCGPATANQTAQDYPACKNGDTLGLFTICAIGRTEMVIPSRDSGGNDDRTGKPQSLFRTSRIQGQPL